jgi:hypothetical protein
MNLDYRHWTYEELHQICNDLHYNLKVKIVRTVLKPGEKYQWNDYVALLRMHGMSILAIQTSDSGDIEQYENYFLDFIQIGNEPFNIGPSSWTQTPEELNNLVSRARNFFPESLLVMAGLADGDETKLDLLDLDKVDFVACHPGIETPETIDEYIARYMQHSDGLKIMVTEFYNPNLTRQLKANPNVRDAMFFCYDDKMVTPHGLYNHGVKKPAYDVYISQIGDNMADLNVGAGILEAMAVHGDSPIRDSDFITNINGTVYEKGYGTLGFYEASNASGDWRVYFRPF